MENVEGVYIEKNEKEMEEVSTEQDVISSKSEDDPYAYLERADFSAEKFKIEIKNLPKIYGMNVN